MASQEYQNIIKGLQPVEWNRNHPAADGEWITKNLLQPTHKKDEQLAKGLDNTIDRMTTFESKITTLTNTVSGAVQTVNAMASTVNEHTTEIEELDSEKQDKIYVDSSTIAGTGTSDDPYTVIGGGGGSKNVYVPNVENGQLNYNLSATSAAEATLGPWEIKGDKGDEGDPGKSPELSANNANIYWKYSDATSGWTDLGNFKGDTGAKGNDGDPGKSPELSANNSNIYWKYSDATSGWTNLGNFKGDTGSQGPAGANGKDGEDGCPISATSESISDSQHPAGGQHVTVFYTSATSNPIAEFNIWNGENGTGASYTFTGSNGVKVTPNGTNVTIELSGGTYVTTLSAGYADYAEYAYLGLDSQDNPITSAFDDIVNELHGKLDKSIWDSNSGKFVTSAGLTGDDKQYAMTTTGWAEITGGGSSFTGAKTNNWISGDGTSNNPIGLSAEATSAIEAMADQYQIDGGQYVSVVPNSTTHKVVVGLDNQATNAIADVIANADIWDAASAVSAKSHVTIDNTTNTITTVNQGTSASLSAVEYKDNVNVAGMNVQQIYAVRNDDDIYACLSTTANKGTLFFVCSGVA